MNIFTAIRERSIREKNRRYYFGNEHYWEVRYLCATFTIDFYRSPRGCLVDVYYKGKRISDWVDSPVTSEVSELRVLDNFEFNNLKQAIKAFN